MTEASTIPQTAAGDQPSGGFIVYTAPRAFPVGFLGRGDQIAPAPASSDDVSVRATVLNKDGEVATDDGGVFDSLAELLSQRLTKAARDRAHVGWHTIAWMHDQPAYPSWTTHRRVWVAPAPDCPACTSAELVPVPVDVPGYGKPLALQVSTHMVAEPVFDCPAGETSVARIPVLVDPWAELGPPLAATIPAGWSARAEGNSNPGGPMPDDAAA